MIKKLKKNKSLLAFLASLTLGSLIIIPGIIAGGGVYNVFADFNFQQIPFNEYINSALKSGNIFWNNVNDLGSNTIGTFSFYNMFSIFNIIGYIFPSKWFPYLIGPIFILKYAVSGFTSYLYLQRYVKNKNYAVIGSLLYSFSGFQMTNILFYHFHDVVALFPLLLYSFDNLIYDDRKGKFCLTVSLLLFTNWFFFIGEVVFVIIYYLIKILTKEIKFDLKKFTYIFIESVIGVGLAAIILIPTLLFIKGNPRVVNNWNLVDMFKYKMNPMYFSILKAFIMPPDVMNYSSVYTTNYYFSTEIFLPFIGIIYMIPYILKNKNNWISVSIFAYIIIMLIPILNNMFFAFTTSYYSRWFFMPILIFVLASIKSMEEKYDIKIGIITIIFGYIILCLGLLLYYLRGYNLIYYKQYALNSSTVLLICILLNILIYHIKNINKYITCIILSIFIYTTVWGNYMYYEYKSKTFKIDELYVDYLNSYKLLEFDDSIRVNGDDTCYYNFGYLNNFSYLKTFNSNINESSFKFYDSISHERTIYTYFNPENDKDINDFLSVKYIISCNDTLNLENSGYKFYKKIGNYNIYMNEDYLDYGFSVENYMLNEKFKKLSISQKKKILKNTVVLNKTQEKKYKDLYNNKKSNYKSNNFKYIKNGFESNIDSENDILAIYTIPYDKGFRATINGKKVKIENVDNGLMAIKINKGKNNIVFKYIPQGFKIGNLVSVVSLILLVIYYKKIKKEN